MDLSQPITRRAAIKDMGKAGLAVMIFGTACTSESSPTTSSDTTATAAPVTSASVSPSTTSVATTTQWSRVNMGFVSAYLLYRGDEAALVDTGQSGAEADIAATLESLGLGWDSVTSVIVTHKHPDHAGSVLAIAGLAVNSNTYAGEGDLTALPPLEAQGPVPVGDTDMVFGLEIVETPGHTPGHISVYDPSAGILVAGDAMNSRGGQIQSASADPNFTDDLALADESVRKLAGFEYEVVLFGHGEPILQNGTVEVNALASSLPG